jgi:hypothetical protein
MKVTVTSEGNESQFFIECKLEIKKVVDFFEPMPSCSSNGFCQLFARRITKPIPWSSELLHPAICAEHESMLSPFWIEGRLTKTQALQRWVGSGPALDATIVAGHP